MALLRTLTDTPQHLLRVAPTLGLGPAPQYFTQKTDHFDESSDRTWSQAFYVNDTFWVPGSDAPIFVCVGGEGPALTGASVVASVHCSVASQWLAETKALMFGVEHRYYGCHNASACPVDSMSSTARRLKSSTLYVPAPSSSSPPAPSSPPPAPSSASRASDRGAAPVGAPPPAVWSALARCELVAARASRTGVAPSCRS